jgi:hypothetical protein
MGEPACHKPANNSDSQIPRGRPSCPPGGFEGEPLRIYAFMLSGHSVRSGSGSFRPT